MRQLQRFMQDAFGSWYVVPANQAERWQELLVSDSLSDEFKAIGWALVHGPTEYVFEGPITPVSLLPISNPDTDTPRGGYYRQGP